MSDNNNTVVAKTVAMCVLFAASMTLGSLPLILRTIFHWKTDADNPSVQLLLCLGGGVLLCTTFMHLLPEVSEKISYLDSEEIHYAELLMCIGFFAMYFLEECIHWYLHRRIQTKSLHNICNEDITNVTDEKEHKHFVSGGAATNDQFSAFRGLFVILGLSIHELFEGLAVGLETSNANVWYMFGAVSAHKLVIAFCIGVELIASQLKNWLVLVYVFTFAVVSPIGIGIGLGVSAKRESSTHLPSILLQGLASGSLLYVVFFEVLTVKRKSGLKQFFAVLAGFCLMFGITCLE